MVKYEILHQIAGRVRLRVQGLKDDSYCNHLSQALMNDTRIEGVSINKACASLTVNFKQKALTVKDILELLEGLERQKKAKGFTLIKKERPAKGIAEKQEAPSGPFTEEKVLTQRKEPPVVPDQETEQGIEEIPIKKAGGSVKGTEKRRIRKRQEKVQKAKKRPSPSGMEQALDASDSKEETLPGLEEETIPSGQEG